MALKKPRLIAIEEHYIDPEIASHLKGERPAAIAERLEDFTSIRIREMDEAGLDMQVLSHAPPGTHKFEPELAVKLSRSTNDLLHRRIAENPTRFAGLAALPVQDPKAAADELERAVTKLGFKGGIIHGLTNERFVDDKASWPLYERAAELGVPIYLHPARPHSAVFDAYYGDYVGDFPLIAGPAWGYTVETATMAIRLVLSGVFEAYPKLQFIIGHMGEGLPFLLWRIDYSLKRPGNKAIEFRELFCNHFHITTSGNFSDTALLCSVMEMGADRILYAVDWPFVPNKPGTDWINRVPLSEEDKAKIMHGNAERLLGV